MILLVSGATKTLRELNRPDRLGHLLTPDDGNIVPTGGVWACDNSAFQGFQPARFCSFLGKIAGKQCLWVACPDVVGDARATADLFYAWRPVIKALNLPVALVLQDGQERVGVPWNLIDAVFVGGSTPFKLGPVAASIVREAKRRGLWAHMGRVNSRQRLRYALELGCDSCDGSGFSRFPARDLPSALRWLEELERQPSLLAA